MRPVYRLLLLPLLACAACAPASPGDAPEAPTTAVADTARTPCSMCAEWNVPHPPVRIYGDTYYVGTDGLSAILVTSPEGHVLLDGALPESAPLVAANVEALGFKMEDVRLILNSHAHFDHAGGIAALQRLSGAEVAASPASAAVLEAGVPGPDDPQYAELLPIPFPGVKNVREISDGDTLRVGPLAFVAHFTPGHTAGGTTWTWTACEADRCLDLVYADSMTPVSEEGYRFSESTRYPTILDDFERGFAVLEALPCDVLLAPHPGASALWERVAARAQGADDALVDATACARYASTARQKLTDRLASEK